MLSLLKFGKWLYNNKWLHMKLLCNITLNDYKHFNNTNQKTYPGDMYVNLAVKKELLFFTLLTWDFILLWLSLLKAKGKFMILSGQANYTNKSHFQHLSNELVIHSEISEWIIKVLYESNSLFLLPNPSWYLLVWKCG